ncbi:hypothetical protein [Klebsiella quasipneumoniae]|uniref:hypothetical protein n=1 Tax=Klebsiella quasipneumoniae TaxID=1463165 RepID=UPI003D6D0431
MLEISLSYQHPPETRRHSPLCIAMQPRQNHQERFLGFRVLKGTGNGHQAAEKR